VSRFPPYGRQLAAGGQLEADVAELAVLEAIATLSAGGLSLRVTSAALATRGVLARNGRPFAVSTLSRLVPKSRGLQLFREVFAVKIAIWGVTSPLPHVGH